MYGGSPRPAETVEVIDPATQAVIGHCSGHGLDGNPRGNRGGRKQPLRIWKKKTHAERAALLEALARADAGALEDLALILTIGTGQAARRSAG